MLAEIRLDGSRVVVKSRYSAILVDRFKMIPGRHYNPEEKAWDFPAVKDVLLMVTDACGLLPEMLPAEIKQIMVDGGYTGPKQPPVDMSLVEGHEFLTPPFEHQRVELARLLQHDRWLCASEQGTGKSFVICNRIFRLLLENYGRKILILCPKSVVGVWKDELMKHAGLLCDVIDGKPIGQRQQLGGGRNIKIANYEKLLHSIDDYLKVGFDAIIADEVHRCKNHSSQTSKAVRKLSGQAKWVWGLSGTPAPNSLDDWLGVLETISPGILPCKGARGEATKTEFQSRYCLKEQLGGSGPFVVTGYRNVAELHGYVASITSRYTKDECLDLPPKVYSSRLVALQGEQARVYRELKKDACATLKELGRQGILTVKNILSESLRLLQVVGGFVPDDAGVLHELPEKAKWTALQEVLEEIGDRQVVIWCKFLPEVRFLAGKLAQIGEVGSIVGETDADERRDVIDAFQKGGLRFFLGTSAGGTGITLHAADTEIFYSRDYNLGNYLQQTDRLHRIGQKRTVSVVKLIASRTVDETVDSKLDAKGDLMEMLLQKPEEYL